MLGVLTHRNLPKVNQRAAAPVAARRPGAGRDLLPDAGRRRALRRPAGRDRDRRQPRAGPATPRRWSQVSYDRDAVGHHDRPGPRGRLRAGEDLRRPHAGPRTSAATSTRRSRRRTSASTRRSGSPPTTTTRSRRSTTTAVWDGDRLTLYDSCQGIKAVQLTVAALLGMSLSKVRVLDAVRRRRASAARRWSGRT